MFSVPIPARASSRCSVLPDSSAGTPVRTVPATWRRELGEILQVAFIRLRSRIEAEIRQGGIRLLHGKKDDQAVVRGEICVLHQQQAGIEGRRHGRDPGGVDDHPGDGGDGEHGFTSCNCSGRN